MTDARFLSSSRWLVALVAVGFVASLARADSDEDTLPTLKEAIQKEIHAKVRVKKNRIDLTYDFKKEAQGEDFAEAAGMISLGGGISVNLGKGTDKAMQIEGGRLPLKGGTQVKLKAPLESVQRLTLAVGGIESFHAQLRGPGQSLNFWIGESTGVGLGEDGFRNLWSSNKSLNLQPKKTYNIEISITKKAATAKLDGRKILQAALPSDFVLPNQVAFSSDSEKRGHVLRLHVRGTVSNDVVEIAANRGRGEAGKPPLFVEKGRVVGDHFVARSQSSEKHAIEWLEKTESVASRIFEDFPTKERSSTEKRELYIFSSEAVYDAYCGKLRGGKLPGGALAILDAPEEENEDDPTVIDFDISKFVVQESPMETLVSGLLRQVHASAPYWWRQGCLVYYSSVIVQDGSFVIGTPQPELAMQARAYIDNRESPRLSAMLEDPSVKNAKARAMAWAWVYFLMKAEDGAHRPHLKTFHEALLGGKSGEEAGEAAFPTATFNDLYPKFLAFLQTI